MSQLTPAQAASIQASIASIQAGINSYAASQGVSLQANPGGTYTAVPSGGGSSTPAPSGGGGSSAPATTPTSSSSGTTQLYLKSTGQVYNVPTNQVSNYMASGAWSTSPGGSSEGNSNAGAISSVQAQLSAAQQQAAQLAAARGGTYNPATNTVSYAEPVLPPVPPPTPIPLIPTSTTTKAPYTVQEGSNLTASAKAMGISLQQLLDANPQYKANPNAVQSGAKLNYPGASPVTSTDNRNAQIQAVQDELKRKQAELAIEQQKELESKTKEAQTVEAQAIIDRLKKEAGMPPDVYSSEGLLKILQSEHGTTAIMEGINAASAEIRNLQASYRAGIAAQGNELAPMDLITSRQRELSDQYNIKLDQLQNNKQILVDEYNLKVSNINSIMEARREDYNMAKDAYDSKFSQAIQMMTLTNSMENTRADNARANLTATMNMLQNVDPSLITDEMWANVSTMEMQGGLTAGVSRFVLENSTDEIMMEGSTENADGTKSMYVMRKGKDGVPYMQIVGTVGTGDGTGPGLNGYKATGFGSRLQFALDQNLGAEDAAWEVWTNFAKDSGTKVTYAQILAEANALYNKRESATGGGDNMTTWDVPQTVELTPIQKDIAKVKEQFAKVGYPNLSTSSDSFRKALMEYGYTSQEIYNATKSGWESTVEGGRSIVNNIVNLFGGK